jgi:hypothetical protein
MTAELASDAVQLEPNPILVEVANAQNQSALKVHWRQGERRLGYYSVLRADLERLGKSMRDRLERLVHTVRDNGGDQCGKQLKDLATDGRYFYQYLFDSDDRKDEALRIRDWLESEGNRYRIHIDVEASIHLPWGLIYGSDPDALRGDAGESGIDKYGDFWCLKHHVSMLYSRPLLERAEIEADKFHVLPIINRSVLEEVRKHLGDIEAEAWNAILEGRNPVYDKSDAFSRWKSMNDKHGMLYFLCHGDGKQLSLAAPLDESRDRIISIDEFRWNFERKAARNGTGTFVFLNACATAKGEVTGGFFEALGRDGFFGYIGTEATVPNVFAQRFGLMFLNEFLYSNRQLFEVMSQLRRQFWPLSLLYSVYCFPRLKIVGGEDRRRLSDLPADYFSRGKVGSDL